MKRKDPAFNVARRLRRASREGSFSYSAHVGHRMAQRHANVADLSEVVESGKIVTSEWDEEHDNWRVVVEAIGLRVVLGVEDDRDHFNFVTVHDIKG